MSDTKVVTGKVRFSYVNVFEPTVASEGKSAKYSVAILIPKSDKKTLSKIKAAIDVAKELGKVKLGGKIPANLKTPLRDGDVDREDDENYKDHYFLNANANVDYKPQVVDAELNPILDRSEFYSGCYGRASISFYAYNREGNRGIAAGLNNLQKLEDGERLSGGSSAESDFGSDNDDLL